MEVSILGEVVGCDQPHAMCQWHIEYDEWVAIEGATYGQTQTGSPWNHPIDATFAASNAPNGPIGPNGSLNGPLNGPRLVVKVDGGYGFCHMAPGDTYIKCWRPVSSMRDEATAFFLGNTPTLVNDDIISQSTHRHRLVTLPAAVVHVHLAILARPAAA